MEEIDIPFGRKDSELHEATYIIPEGYSAIINGNEIIVKKIDEEINLYPYSDKDAVDKIASGVKEELDKQLKHSLNMGAKEAWIADVAVRILASCPSRYMSLDGMNFIPSAEYAAKQAKLMADVIFD